MVFANGVHCRRNRNRNPTHLPDREFARTLGSTDLAGWTFLAIGMANDVVALTVPAAAVENVGVINQLSTVPPSTLLLKLAAT